MKKNRHEKILELIAKEEIQAYFFDQKSLDSVTGLMNNRTKLYKDEQQ